MSFRLGDFKAQIDPAVRPVKDGKRIGRGNDALRNVKITPAINKHAEGSAFIEMGDTRVICTASVEERVPMFLKGKAEGWVTSEYGMLPRATGTRSQREVSRGGASGRTHEIQRLIGRSLRAVVDMKMLGERTVTVDCDVIQADGGTRCASITGGYVALALALLRLRNQGTIAKLPLLDHVAAVSVGRVAGAVRLDLDYEEDSSAEVDMNVVKTGRGRFIELQGTAEHRTFTDDDLAELLAAAAAGINSLVAAQREVLGELAFRKSED